ncbi:MAG: hypothetical protein ACXWV5_11880 [Flavitalea sp.]
MNNPQPIPEPSEHDNLRKEKEADFNKKQQEQQQSTDRSYNPDGLYNSEVPNPNDEKESSSEIDQQPNSN